jgi:hypothetical protein
MIGRLYKIVSTADKSFYIGSTRQSLAMRLKNHRSKSKDPVRQKTPLYVYFNRVGWIHAQIELLSELEDVSDADLLGMEKAEICAAIADPNCLNKATPLRTAEDKKQMDKEYGKLRRARKGDEERARVRQWRLDNPEKYADQCRRANERAKEKRAAQKNNLTN